jgi:hypothetical protein
MDYEQALLMALGYDTVTVDRVDWGVEYTQSTFMLCRRFYELFKTLRIADRISEWEYVKVCDECCAEMRSYILFRGEPQTCGHQKYHYGGFKYLKLSKLLLFSIFAGGPAVKFTDGVPLWIKDHGCNKYQTFEFETNQRLILEIRDGRFETVISPVTEAIDKSIKIEWYKDPYTLSEYLEKFGYEASNFDTVFTRKPEHRITVGDTQILIHPYNIYIYRFQTDLPKGINRIYMVCKTDGCCRLYGMVDRFGKHLRNYSNIKTIKFAFTQQYPKHDCPGIVYKLDGFWDFSERIPEGILCYRPLECCHHLVQFN